MPPCEGWRHLQAGKDKLGSRQTGRPGALLRDAALTCALGLVGPVSTVVLPVALPPGGDAAPVSALVLEVPGAAGNVGGSG